jgi:S1-C subfamily serine protease
LRRVLISSRATQFQSKGFRVVAEKSGAVRPWRLAAVSALAALLTGCAPPVSELEPRYSDSLYQPPRDMQQFMDQILGVTYRIECKTGSGSGWGISVEHKGEAQDFIVTNAHVVQKCSKPGERILVSDSMGRSFYTKFVISALRREDYDLDISKRDLALLEPILSSINTIEVLSNDYPVGSWVMTASYPTLGFESEGSISFGHVIAHTRYHGFAIDAVVNPGSSGGLVVNSSGEAIGIIHAVGRKPALNGVGFALPVAQVDELLTRLRIEQARAN